MAKQQLPDINAHFSDWYNEIVYKAELADQSPVRGCIVIRPYGYALWENITSVLDAAFKRTGSKNAAFPLLIPQSYMQREAEHVEGFAPELAVVTHAGGKELEEPLVIRPTSETIVHDMFARWIHSWRDLPLNINQWCNVVRWEKRSRPFLRTTEIWWQEGHTAHETYEEAYAKTYEMIRIYKDFLQNYCAIPVISGEKSAHERFAGADITCTLEAAMHDGKALQMCTSHLLSQNFARSFGMMFQDRDGEQAHPYLTSWGITTRVIGAIVAVHGDQKGIIMPPKLAPYQVVIIPILKGDQKASVIKMAHNIKESLQDTVRVIVDDDESETPGAKFYRWEMKGVPLRVEIGPKDMEQDQAVIVNRIDKHKQAVSIDALPEQIIKQLDATQSALFEHAQAALGKQWHMADKLDTFGPALAKHAGLYQAGWCGCTAGEQALKAYHGTIRCLLPTEQAAVCFYCDKKSLQDVMIAKAY